MAIQWSLVLFSLLAGGGGALFAMIGLAEVRGFCREARFPAALVALVLVLVGGVCSVTHLAQPGNIMAAAANVFSFSGISVELIMVGITLIVFIVYLVACRREGAAGACRAVAVIGAVCGIVLGFVTGNGYVFGAQPNWNTIALPLAYLASDLALGATLFFVIAHLKRDEGDFSATGKQLSLIAAILAVVHLVLSLVYGAVIGFALDALWFWGGAVVIGGVGTAALSFFAGKKLSGLGVLIAALACAFIGGIGLRCAMWLAGTGVVHLFDAAAGFMIL